MIISKAKQLAINLPILLLAITPVPRACNIHDIINNGTKTKSNAKPSVMVVAIIYASQNSFMPMFS